jgi:hypothetical protein
MIGLGGAATVAALAVELDLDLAPVADQVVARWAATDCDPSHDDLYLGHPGALLALAEIAARSPAPAIPRGFVSRCWRRTQVALRRTLAARDHYLGLAHGLAGLLLAAESGAARLGLPRDHELMARGFARLAGARAIAPGLGAVWAPRLADDPAGAGGSWCHGVAGIALALHGCATLTGDPAYRQLFDEASGALLQVPAAEGTFCCGQTGRVQVLIEVYRQGGDRRWLTAARRIRREAGRRALGKEYPEGFAQGRLGPRYATARLRDPDSLALPATGV